MKLDAKAMRYLTAEDFRVLAGVSLPQGAYRFVSG
jgi:RIO-like serine/threonine protein kinase